LARSYFVAYKMDAAMHRPFFDGHRFRQVVPHISLIDDRSIVRLRLGASSAIQRLEVKASSPRTSLPINDRLWKHRYAIDLKGEEAFWTAHVTIVRQSFEQERRLGDRATGLADPGRLERRRREKAVVQP
jgi:hypothetical protein